MSGVAFLAAYGVTWLICGVLWRRASERVAAFATLFQGMVAFPVALGLSALIGAIGQARPVAEEVTQLRSEERRVGKEGRARGARDQGGWKDRERHRQPRTR